MKEKLIIPEKRILEVVGTGIPKPTNNQNTDEMIPARFLKEPDFSNTGIYIYFDERYKDEKPILEHPFNNPKYRGGNILIAGRNYGTGSSREQAPQGLYRYGVRGIIAESYAGIFDSNCATIGIVAVKVLRDDLENIIKDIRGFPFTSIKIDLVEKKIYYASCFGSNPIQNAISFNIPEGTRQSFICGTWDLFSVLPLNEKKIKEVERRLPYLGFE